MYLHSHSFSYLHAHIHRGQEGRVLKTRTYENRTYDLTAKPMTHVKLLVLDVYGYEAPAVKTVTGTDISENQRWFFPPMN